jgi:outer membrane receptor for ferrienterochelin and colicins
VITLLAIAAAAPFGEDDDVDEVVVVTAGRTPHVQGTHPVGVEVVTREEIAASGAETVAGVLQEQPGVNIDRTPNGTAIQLQGMNPEHTLILIDGRRVLGRKDGVIDLSRLNLADVESIEIAKGAGSALYGSDAMAGVVHIRTRRPDDPEAGLHLRLGTLGRVDGNVDASTTTGPVRHKVALTYRRADAWDRHPENPATDAAAIDQKGARYVAVVDPTGPLEVQLDAELQQRRLEAVDGSTTGAILDRVQTIEDTRFGLNVARTAETGLDVRGDLSLSLYRDQFVLDQRGAKDLDIASDNRERMVEGSVVVAGEAGRHQLTAGVDGLQQHLQTDRLETGVADRARVGVFVSDLVELEAGRADVRFAPSIRADLDTQFGSAVTPRLATSVTKGDVVGRLTVGSGFRAPDFRELYLLFENPGVGYVVSGNPDLQPERSLNLSGGLEWANDTFSLAGSAFANRVRDLIQVGDVDLEPGALQRFGYENVAQAFLAGGELQGRAKLAEVDLELGYALVHARDLEQKRALPGRVPHRVTAAVDTRLARGFGLRAQAGLNSARVIYIETTEGDRVEDIPPVVTVDARGHYTTDHLRFFFGIDNVLDVAGTSWSPQPPRQFYLGIDARGRLR